MKYKYIGTKKTPDFGAKLWLRICEQLKLVIIIMCAQRMQSRNWFGTVWLPEDIEYIKTLRYKYCIISDDDHTEEEQLHWHVLLLFANPRTRPGTRTAHWEKPNNLIEARNYCLEKGPNFQEDGEFQVRCQNKQEWTGFVELCKKSTPRELIDSPFSQLYARYRGFAGEVHNQFAEVSIIDGELENIWCTGRAGTGKTKWVWENYPDLYIKDLNKWWDGYHGQETVLLDDWDPRQNVLTQKLKIWADRYPFRAETKGSSMTIRPKRIIITSNYDIDDCFENPQDVEAIRRRFKVYRFLRLGEGPTLD